MTTNKIALAAVVPLVLMSLVACSDAGGSGSGDSKPGSNVVISGDPITEVFIASDVDPNVSEAIQQTLDIAGDC